MTETIHWIYCPTCGDRIGFWSDRARLPVKGRCRECGYYGYGTEVKPRPYRPPPMTYQYDKGFGDLESGRYLRETTSRR